MKKLLTGLICCISSIGLAGGLVTPTLSGVGGSSSGGSVTNLPSTTQVLAGNGNGGALASGLVIAAVVTNGSSTPITNRGGYYDSSVNAFIPSANNIPQLSGNNTYSGGNIFANPISANAGLNTITNLVAKPVLNTNWVFLGTCSGKVVNQCSIQSGGLILTNANSVWTSADVGKWISVRLASSNHMDLVTYITNLNSGFSVGISNAAILSVTNVASRYGYDDTVAAQEAINYLGSNGGGELWVPAPMIIAGPLQDANVNWTNHHNAQLYFPAITPTGTTTIGVDIRGPDCWAVDNDNRVTFNAEAANGGQIWSFLPWADNANHGSVIDCRNFVTPTTLIGNAYPVAINSLRLDFHNIGMSLCWDCNLRGFNAEGATASEMDNVFATVGYGINGIPYLQSNTNTTAFFMPGLFNNNSSLLHHFMVGSGFYNGIAVSDNVNISQGNVELCINGLIYPNGEAGPGYITGVSFQACSNYFANTADVICRLSGDVNIVNAGSPYGTGNLLLDPGNSFDLTDLNLRYIPLGGSSGAVPPNVLTAGGGMNYKTFNNIMPHRPREFRTAQMVILNGDGSGLGDTSAFNIGADDGDINISNVWRKTATIGMPSFNDTNFNTIFYWYAVATNTQWLYIGGAGDEIKAYQGRGAANRITFATSVNDQTDPHSHWSIDNLGNLNPTNGTGTESIGVPTAVSNIVAHNFFGGANNLTNSSTSIPTYPFTVINSAQATNIYNSLNPGATNLLNFAGSTNTGVNLLAVDQTGTNWLIITNSFALSNTNWISGAIYVNGTGHSLFTTPGNIAFTTAGVAGASRLELRCVGTGTNASGIPTAITGLFVGVETNCGPCGMWIPNGSSFTYTNASSGSGNSATTAGGGQAMTTAL